MNVDFKFTGDKLSRFIDETSLDATKERLHHAAAYALRSDVKAWIKRNVPRHHRWARMLSATPTGHLEEAAATVGASANSDRGQVSIKSAGFSRVFRTLVIKPVRAKALTIPISNLSYGSTVGLMAVNGWQIFRPKRSRVLFGQGPDGGDPVPLFLLAGSVTLDQDRSLLPPDEQIRAVCGEAIRKVIYRVLKGN